MRNQVKAVAAMTALGTVALVGLGRGATAPGAVSRAPIAAGASIQAAQTPSPAAQVPAAPLRTSDSLAAVTADLERDIPAWLADAMVPGLSVALVRDGRVAWTRGFGVARADTKEPVTEHTVFEAASLSKPVFAYAVLKLVDQRLLDLDRPLTSYLPGPYDVVDDPRVDQITARHVLSHRTGFPNWRQGPRDKPPLPIALHARRAIQLLGRGFRVSVEGCRADHRAAARGVHEGHGLRAAGHDEQQLRLAGALRPAEGLQPRRPRATGGPDAAEGGQRGGESAHHRVRLRAVCGRGSERHRPRALDRPRDALPQSQPLAGGPNTITRAPGPPVPELAWGLGIGLQRTADGLSFWHWGDNGNNRSFVVAYERPKTARRRPLERRQRHAGGAGHWSGLPSADGLRRCRGSTTGGLASPSHTLLKAHRARRRDRGDRALPRDAESQGPAAISEERVNSIGYALLSAKRVADAIQMFALNVEDHPESSNVHDSLGEAYAINGDRELAIKSYRRSMELNPKNTGGIEALKKLEAVR